MCHAYSKRFWPQIIYVLDHDHFPNRSTHVCLSVLLYERCDLGNYKSCNTRIKHADSRDSCTTKDCFVSVPCPLLHSQTAQACGAHDFHARKIFKLNFMISQYNWQMYIIACILKELLNYFIVSLFFYLFIYILALQVHTYNYRASHIELIFYIIIIFKLLKQFLSLS